MREVNATLVVDLGNSETRVMVQSGVGRNGLVRQRMSLVSNKYASLRDDYVIPETYTEENSSVLHTEDGELFANGLLVDREFSVAPLRPTNLEKKHESKVTMITIQRAFLEGYRMLAQMYRTGMSNLDVTWKVVYLLPPNDISEGAKVLYDKIVGLKTLEFLLPEFSVELKIEGAKVYPEGFAAYIGTLMRRGKVVNEEFAGLLQSTTLIVDIGAGTTDFFVVEGMDTIDSTKSTIQIGGNNVTASLRQKLASAGLNLTDKIIEKGVHTGYVKDGAKTIKVIPALIAAKQDTASVLLGSIISYLESANYNIRTIENLLVVGGGSIASEVEGVKSLSEYVVDRLKDFAPNIQLVDLPKEYKGEDATGSELNPRLLNILGAGVLAEMG